MPPIGDNGGMDIALTVILFIYGLLIGSFINAWLWRMYQQSKPGKAKTELSITKGRSMCPHCGQQLSAADLVPLFSWLWLRGKCRYCRKPISRQYPLVELLTGLIYAASYSYVHPVSGLEWMVFTFWLVIVSGLVFLAVYDAKHLLLPDKVLLPLIAIRALQLLIMVTLSNISVAEGFGFILTGLGIAAVFYAIVALSRGQWMGGGDIKLVFLLGLLLGPQKSLLAMFIAFNSAAIIGVALIATKRKGRRDVIPFGPFLIAGTVVAYLVGEQIISSYLGLLGWPT